MEERASSHSELIPHLFRLEYSKMTAVLCRRFGLQHIETAEDIASETFLKAAEDWGIHGIPQNPTAWLYTVAKNKARDYIKRLTVFETKVKGAIASLIETQTDEDLEFTTEAITDSQLAMMFAVCNPANSTEAQICLALQILCGFSVEEIATAFLTKTETIKKRLQRGRKNLRNDDFHISLLQEEAIHARLDTVLRTIYLLFNEGYFSKSGNGLIRKELCSEAVRLGLILTQNPLTNSTEANALLALMCYQSSRLDARLNNEGETILFEQQDKNLWSTELIDKGNFYLVNACSGNSISKYHLEAGIAYWHTTTNENKKWAHILKLYNELVCLEYSPMTALNRTFALGKVYGKERAVKEAEKLQLDELSQYHSLLGYLYAGMNPDKAVSHYKRAMQLTKSKAEKHTLAKEMEKLARETLS